ncbi:MAG: hypothetical protein ABJC61_02955 [Acidobacteriota bacterium]
MAADSPPRFVIGALAAAGVVLIAVGVARRVSTPAPVAPAPVSFGTAGPPPPSSPAPTPVLPGNTSAGDAAPTAIPGPTRPPGRPLTKPEFLENPGLLETDPTDVGGCRLVQHWDTGYCYVWSRSYGRKISQTTDARCDDLPELRRRMRAAIERGDCE